MFMQKEIRADEFSSEPVPVNDRPTSFIGSMKGTMEILGDIVSPIDVKWEADAEWAFA
jgi:hypothetical protein